MNFTRTIFLFVLISLHSITFGMQPNQLVSIRSTLKRSGSLSIPKVFSETSEPSSYERESSILSRTSSHASSQSSSSDTSPKSTSPSRQSEKVLAELSKAVLKLAKVEPHTFDQEYNIVLQQFVHVKCIKAVEEAEAKRLHEEAQKKALEEMRERLKKEAANYNHLNYPWPGCKEAYTDLQLQQENADYLRKIKHHLPAANACDCP